MNCLLIIFSIRGCKVVFPSPLIFIMEHEFWLSNTAEKKLRIVRSRVRIYAIPLNGSLTYLGVKPTVTMVEYTTGMKVAKSATHSFLIKRK